MALDKKTRGLTIEVGGDVAPLGKSFDDASIKSRNLTAQVSSLQKTIKAMPTMENFRQGQETAKKAVEATAEKVNILKQGLEKLKNEPSGKKTEESIERIKTELAKAEAEAAKAVKELKKMQQMRMDELAKQINGIGKSLEDMGHKLVPVSAGLTAAFVGATKAAIDMESAMAGVDKTTDLTTEELAAMKQEFIDMSKNIPVAATELANIAENAGQLGILKENIVGFTRTMADLGATTNLAGEEAAQTAAKFANVTQMSQGDFDRLGSTVVDLGNNAATTEKDIMDMGMRIAAAGTQAGMTEAQILGIASAASSLGLVAEAGGTAFSKSINAINVAVQTGSEDLEAYAKTAGMTAEQFKAAWQSDAAGAFTEFIKGLDSASKSAIVSLDELGFDAERQRDALARAAISGDLFRESIERGTKAWEENTALAAEASKRYETTESQLTMLKNRVVEIAIQLGDMLLPTIRSIVEAGGNVVEWFAKLDKGTKATVLQVAALVAGLGPMLLLLGKGATSIGSFVSALGAMKAATTAAAKAQAALNAATAAFSAVAIVGAIVGLVAVVGTFVGAAGDAKDETEQLRKELEETTKAHEDAVKSINDAASAQQSEIDRINDLIPRIQELNDKGLSRTNEEQSELNYLVETANGIIPGLIGNIDDLTGKYNLNTTAIYNNVEALKKKYELEANENIIRANYARIAELKRQQDELVAAYGDADAKIKSIVGNAKDIVLALGPNDTQLYKNWKAYGTTLEDVRGELSKLQGENDKLIDSNSDLYGQMEGLAGGTKKAEISTKELSGSTSQSAYNAEDNAKAISTLSGDLEKAAKSYYDVADAEKFSASGAAALLTEYQGLLAANPQLLAQHADLYAALSDENTLQENSAEIAKAIFNINRQLLADQLTDQRNALNEKIKTLEAEREAAISTYSEIGGAAAMAYAIAASGAVNDAKAQADNLSKMIDGLKKTDLGAYKPKVGGSGKKSGSSDSKTKEKTPEEIALQDYKDGVKALEHEKAMSELSKEEAEAEYREKEKALRELYLNGDLDLHRDAYWKSLEAEKKHLDDKDEIRRKAEEDEAEARKQAAFDDLKFERDVEIISEGEYYANLAALRDEYLDENSKEWRSATKEIYDYLNRQQQEALKSEEEALKTHNDRIKSLAQERVAAINALIAAEEKRVKTEVEGIDALIQKRRELREDEENEDKVARAKKRLDAAMAELAFARDKNDAIGKAQEAMRAQTAYDAALKGAEDTLFYRQMEAQKASLRQGLEDFKERAQYDIDNADLWAASNAGPSISAAQYSAKATTDSLAALLPKLIQSIINTTDSRSYSSQLNVYPQGNVTNSQLLMLVEQLMKQLGQIDI